MTDLGELLLELRHQLVSFKAVVLGDALDADFGQAGDVLLADVAQEQ